MCGVSLVALVGAGLIAVVVVVLGYRRGWQWTGLPARAAAGPGAEERPAKTLWDWLALLGIPVALAALAFLLNDAQSRRDQQREDRRTKQQRRSAIDAERESTLRAYLAQMSDLMLQHHLLRSQRQADVREVARTATLTAVRRLDGPRRGVVVRFVSEARLLQNRLTGVPLVIASADLRRADLEGADLHQAYLSDVDLRGAHLRGANLIGADLIADLRRADLREAALLRARLDHARLEEADLRRADLTEAELAEANLTEARLEGARLEGTFLTGTNLVGVEFRGAYLIRADLSNADLRRADLHGADLADTDLEGADLHGADLRRANLEGADLHGARGVNMKGARGEPAREP
jgi:uncharacterized protein YjbI with pentapeptide repeats